MVIKFPARDKEARKVVPYQVEDLKKALKYVKNFSVCVQAGGNVGIWPKYLAKHFDYVYTFEPDEENFQCLLQNAKERNIIKENSALGENISCGALEGDAENCGAYQVIDGDDFDILTIDSLGLDALDFLCLDIEGMELMAIKGGLDTIKTFSPVIMLEDKGLSEKYGTKKGFIEDYLKAIGYEVKERIHRDIVFVRA